MSDLMVIESVEQAVQLYTSRQPEHPLIHVVDLSDTHIKQGLLNTRICTNLFTISIKHSACSPIRYGRQHYDFSSGVLTAYGPGQTVHIEEIYEPGELAGWSLFFHADLLLGHPLQRSIKEYGYFSYEVCEALHMSECEQHTLAGLASEITRESQQNLDAFSLDILLANVELILKYTDRYFHRQFLTRRPFYQDSVERFSAFVEEHMKSSREGDSGLPTVNQLAEQMHMSPNYMSDMLRKETGKSAQEMIHHHLIEEAKYLLLNSQHSVATIAYQLGFEYPQYFSRLFKKKTALSPQDFRKLN